VTILLVRPRLIGDVVLTTPSIQALRRRFPDARLLYLVEALAAPIVAHNPQIDRTFVIRHRRGWRRWLEDLRLARTLRSERIDIAVDLHGGPRSGWLTWATRAPMRVGYDVSGRRWMFTHRVPRPRGYQPRHSVLNQWDLLVPVIGAPVDAPSPERERVLMPVPDSARASVAAKLAALGVGTGDDVVVMHASAGNEFRRWPVASFRAVATALTSDRPDRRVIVLGDRSDESLAAAIAGDAGTSRILPALGWPLEDVRALMERASLFVGGDSGPMHIAATTDVPIVALFGPTLPALWTPWRPARLPLAIVENGPLPCRPCDQRVCAPGDFRCLRTIEPARVIAAARQLLEAHA
jgi:predicted lipopolysaccharide heptosyltransferase III